MRILIVYYSQTRNTEKIAAAMSEELSAHGHEVRLERVEGIAPDLLDGYDLVFLGSACHDADLAQPAKRFLEAIPNAPTYELAGFVTHATYMGEGGNRERELYETWAGKCLQTFQRVSQEKDIPFLDFFHCQGAPIPEIAEFIHRTIVTDEEEWDGYIEEVNQHPDEEDLQRAREFAGRVAAASNPSTA
ncbi:MAG TPA: hypothetical protein G4O08_01405 [Anaerolineae bacterium]|nr:hypothetical protein [Anaerolineae bacterium]